MSLKELAIGVTLVWAVLFVFIFGPIVKDLSLKPEPQVENQMEQKEERRMAPYNYNVLEYRVIDGDTVEAVLDLGFDIRKKISVRISGVNTPERRGSEKRAGIPVTLVVQHYLTDNQPLVVESHEWGKYAGRCLGDIVDSQNRQGLAHFLIINGFGKLYANPDGTRTTYDEQELDHIRQLAYNYLIGDFTRYLSEVEEIVNEQSTMVAFGQEFGFIDQQLMLTPKADSLLEERDYDK